MDVGQILMKGTSGPKNTAETDQAGRAEYKNGRTVGNPKLSKEGAKYYEELKKKYGDMDFVLVSAEEKENAKKNAAAFANPAKPVVLIDTDKVERMATDDSFRKQYEGIIDSAKKQLPAISQAIGQTGADVKGYGIQVNDNGTASFFAVMDKSMTEQRERLAEKRAEKKAEAKAEAKKAEQREWKEKLEGSREEKETETLFSDSLEGLLQKVRDFQFAVRSDSVLSEAELSYGQSIDYRG
ncbi:MAG: hypothetical protein II754_01680 [Lachnospiraceae bacterium]|nr:hypothetical protein [Lachnospiraceae bacterium]